MKLAMKPVMERTVLIATALAAPGLIASPALAVEPSAQHQAAQAYAAGAAAFKAKQYAAALASFERAFKLDPVPILLYNIARCHEEMGNAQEAVTGFRLYLARAPQAADRADVERRIRVMEAILKRQAATPAAPPSAAPPSAAPPSAAPASVAEPAESEWQLPWGIGLASAGGLGVAVGVVFGASARSNEDAHRAANDDATKSARWADAESDASIATASTIIGGVLLAGGLGLILWDVLTDTPAAGVDVTPLPGGGAAMGWRIAF